MNDFNKVVIDLENLGFKVDDEDQVIIILNSLSKSYALYRECNMLG